MNSQGRPESFSEEKSAAITSCISSMGMVSPRRISKTKKWTNNLSTLGLMCIVITSLLLAVIFLTSNAEPTLSVEQLESLVNDIKGDDVRLMRWDATKYTHKRQSHGGCDHLPTALNTIIQSKDDKTQRLACEYATFCITDNPKERAILAQTQGIHQAVTNLVSSKDAQVSAMASHLIYIGSFANADNHQGFVKAGAVKALAAVCKQTKPLAVQAMYAAAALQNLAASYCDTEDDGRCYWYWTEKKDHVVIEEDSLPLVSDGTRVRQEMLRDQDLVDILKKMACMGPVQGEMSSKNPFPGENAHMGRDDASPNVLAWAATGALKNLALEPKAKVLLESTMPCFCRLSHSSDWLEENKGEGVLHHMRRTDPCWFENDDHTGKLCIDKHFLDIEGYTCEDYDDASEEECEQVDKAGTKAESACCACGGGDREADHEEL